MKIGLTVLLFTTLLITACTRSESEVSVKTQLDVISGQVIYLERRLLPPGAELTVNLEDVSKRDVVSTLIATTSQLLDGAPPYTFSLSYDGNLIQSKMSYSLRAKITLNGRLLMTSTNRMDPFVDPNSPISIQLTSVATKAQTQAKPETAQAVVSVNPLANLTNTYWKLLSMNGQAVIMGELQTREAFIQLVETGSSVKGFAGCNVISGTFTTRGNDLSFGPIAATRKACPSGMEDETRMLNVLAATSYYSIHEHHLTLLNDDKKKIARFQAQYFN